MAPVDSSSNPSTQRSPSETLRAPFHKRTPGEAPVLQLGTMNFGGRTPETESVRIVRRALELGIGVYDTANAYNGGESERILGRALGADRARVQLATKVGFRRVGGKPEGLGKVQVVRALEDSLARLGTDSVDVFYLHVPDHHTPLDETLEAIAKLIGRGLCKAWGVSNYASWQILEMVHLAPSFGLPRPVLSQQMYNLLIRQLDVEYARFSERYQLATCTYNPLAGGLLSGKHARGNITKGSRFDTNAMYRGRYLHDVAFDHVEALREVAKEVDMSLLELSYAWHRSRSVVDAVIVGPASVEHLDAAHQAMQREVPAPALRRIDELSVYFAGTDATYAR